MQWHVSLFFSPKTFENPKFYNFSFLELFLACNLLRAAEAEVVEQHHLRSYELAVQKARRAENRLLVLSAAPRNQCLVPEHLDFASRLAIGQIGCCVDGCSLGFGLHFDLHSHCAGLTSSSFLSKHSAWKLWWWRLADFQSIDTSFRISCRCSRLCGRLCVVGSRLGSLPCLGARSQGRWFGPQRSTWKGQRWKMWQWRNADNAHSHCWFVLISFAADDLLEFVWGLIPLAASKWFQMLSLPLRAFGQSEFTLGALRRSPHPSLQPAKP